MTIEEQAMSVAQRLLESYRLESSRAEGLIDDYDEPGCYAFCPDCGSPLMFSEGFEEVQWCCDECEGFMKDDEPTNPHDDQADLTLNGWK